MGNKYAIKEWWFYSNLVEDISFFPDDIYGFVYILWYSDGKRYIGKKSLYCFKTMNPLANGKIRNGHQFFFNKILNHKKVQREMVKVESNWLEYQGSFDGAKEKRPEKKEIVYLAKSNQELAYLEAKLIFEHDALRNMYYINENVIGRFYRDKLLTRTGQ